MKKIILLSVFIFSILSCTPDDKGYNYRYEVLKVESFEVPTEFISGNTYQIKIKYKRPTSCHYFNNIYFNREGNIRKIAVECLIEERENCIQLFDNNPEIEYIFNFDVIQAAGSDYLFKFYKGKNAAGEHIFDEVTIPVI
ncbi:MAG: hypothetical protein ACOVQ2_04890 [Flavobacterium sp.]|jgi:hypothetical protein